MASYGGQASDGMRAARHQKARERELEEATFKRRKLADELKLDNMETKFSAHYDAVEQEIKANTVGLLTIDQMKQTQERAVMEREKQLARREKEKRREERDKLKKKEERKMREKKQIKSLSFNPEDDEEEEDGEEINGDQDEIFEQKERSKSPDNSECVSSPEVDAEGRKKRFGMNPEVDTSFLPDRDRDEQENELRERLRREWEDKQKIIKNEEVEIIYSYWDGSGHRKSITMKKGNTIYQFLVKVLDSVRSEFPELKTVSADQLMYVKEDLIIPQHNTFYDFIVSRARGKSGPLFSFDAHEDVRLVSDARIEKDESHAGKVILRNWYERNKHIFPASRWEPYDPTKLYEKYSVADSNKQENEPGSVQFLSKTHEGSNFMNNVKAKESEEETNVLKKLAMGSQSGCRGMCKCSKSVVCEMHYQAKSFR